VQLTASSRVQHKSLSDHLVACWWLLQLSSVVLVYLYYKWIPHLHAWVNHVRVGSYAAIAWCSLLFVIVAFARGDDDSAVNQRSQVSGCEE
jgi:hypothetical protein